MTDARARVFDPSSATRQAAAPPLGPEQERVPAAWQAAAGCVRAW